MRKLTSSAENIDRRIFVFSRTEGEDETGVFFPLLRGAKIICFTAFLELGVVSFLFDAFFLANIHIHIKATAEKSQEDIGLQADLFDG